MNSSSALKFSPPAAGISFFDVASKCYTLLEHDPSYPGDQHVLDRIALHHERAAVEPREGRLQLLLRRVLGGPLVHLLEQCPAGGCQRTCCSAWCRDTSALFGTYKQLGSTPTPCRTSGVGVQR